MSILKSTVAGKSGLPITVEWLLSHGWEYRSRPDIDTGKPVQDFTKLYCSGHFLNLETYVDFNLQRHTNIVWTYKTNAAIYKFYIKTFGDYDKIVEYYNEYRQKERAKIKNKILNQPEIKRESMIWFDKKLKKKENTTEDSFKVRFHEVDLFWTDEDNESED